MKSERLVIPALIVVVLGGLLCTPVSAQSRDAEVALVLQDRGWHGTGGDMQVHYPTLRIELPTISLWQRSPVGPQYGEWLYVKVLINCEQWKMVPFAGLDENGNFGLIEELIGSTPPVFSPDPGTETYRAMTAVCGQYGYSRAQGAPRTKPGGWVER